MSLNVTASYPARPRLVPVIAPIIGISFAPTGRCVRPEGSTCIRAYVRTCVRPSGHVYPKSSSLAARGWWGRRTVWVVSHPQHPGPSHPWAWPRNRSSRCRRSSCLPMHPYPMRHPTLDDPGLLDHELESGQFPESAMCANTARGHRVANHETERAAYLGILS